MRRAKLERSDHTPYLLVKACQHLWLNGAHEVYQQFTYIIHIILSNSRSSLMLPDLSFPQGSLSSPYGHGLYCPPSFIQQTPAVKYACRSRKLSAIRQVKPPYFKGLTIIFSDFVSQRVQRRVIFVFRFLWYKVC